MSTAAQIEANRVNAQLSAGPRSVEGKAASSRNALKLGIHAESLIIPGEDPDALARLSASCHEQLCAHGVLETELVEIIIRSTWLQRRLTLIEAQVMSARLAALEPDTRFPLGEMFIQDCEGARTIDKLSRRQQSVQRDFFRALSELRRLQQARVQSAMMDDLESPEPDRVRFDESAAPPAPAGGPAATPVRPPNNPALRL